MSTVGRLTAGVGFLVAMVMAASVNAAELKLLSVDAMKPAIEELAKSFAASSKDKLKVEYASPAEVEKKINAEDDYDIVIADTATTHKFYVAAKIAGGSTKKLAKQDAKTGYEASMTNWCQQPLAGNALLEFLSNPKAAEVYKAKGLQPG